MIKLDITKALENAAQAATLKEKVAAAQEALENGTCPGNDFLGWLHLPSSITAPAAIQTERGIREKSRVQASAPEEMVSMATTSDLPGESPPR